MNRPFPLVLAAILLAPAAHAQTLVMRDDFSSKSSGWSDSTGRAHRDRGFNVYTGTGKYQMTPTDDRTLGMSIAPRQATGGDVRIDADLFMYAGVGGGASGVVCRHRDHDNTYAFLVSGAPEWVILKVQGGKPTQLARGPLPRGVMPGAVEGRLQATCEGNRLSMSFNGRPLGEARDTTFAGGKSGLMVMGEKMAGTSATFDSFQLHDLSR